MSDNSSDLPISALIGQAMSADAVVAGPAARELLQRHQECLPCIPEVVALLRHGNAAVEDLAYRTLERIGPNAVPAIIDALKTATERYRCYLLSLLCALAEPTTYFPILERELGGKEDDIRFHAANCLVRSFSICEMWPDDARPCLQHSIDLLRACLKEAALAMYHSQARITLNQLPPELKG